jgi:predicted ATPase with chaperone activity
LLRFSNVSENISESSSDGIIFYDLFNEILKIAKAIADLEESENILSHHISKVIQYKSLDREFWNV